MVGTVVTNLCPQDICLHIIKMSLFHLSSQVTFIAFYFVEKKKNTNQPILTYFSFAVSFYK